MLHAMRERIIPRKTSPAPLDLGAFTAEWLTPNLRSTLASLYGTPDEVIDAVIQLLPLGSRTALTKTEPALALEISRRKGWRQLKLTPFGQLVIQYLATHPVPVQERTEDLAAPKHDAEHRSSPGLLPHG